MGRGRRRCKASNRTAAPLLRELSRPSSSKVEYGIVAVEGKRTLVPIGGSNGSGTDQLFLAGSTSSFQGLRYSRVRNFRASLWRVVHFSVSQSSFSLLRSATLPSRQVVVDR